MFPPNGKNGRVERRPANSKRGKCEITWPSLPFARKKCAALKVDGTSFQVFWICKLWKERTKSQLNVITKFVYDSIAKLVLVQKQQLFCHQLLPWQRYLMIVQTYFWASKAHTLKTNLVTPNFFTLVSLSFENETTWSFKKISTKRIFYKR